MTASRSLLPRESVGVVLSSCWGLVAARETELRAQTMGTETERTQREIWGGHGPGAREGEGGREGGVEGGKESSSIGVREDERVTIGVRTQC